MTAADTCRRVAAIRAIASEDPSHPYSEPLATILAGKDQIEAVRGLNLKQLKDDDEGEDASPAPPKEVNAVVLRAMLLDHLLVEECTKDKNGRTSATSSSKQIVILGAGMDTRAHRLKIPGTTSIKWFEVDQDEVVTLKEDILNEHEKNTKDNISSVVRLKLDLAVDLDRLFPSLEANGFDPSAPTIFILEGLLYYVPLEGITKLLDALATVPNSTMLLTMIDQEMLQYVRTEAKSDHIDEAIRRTFENLDQIWKTDLSNISQKEVLGNWKITRQICTANKEWAARLCPGWAVGRSFLKGGEHILQLEQHSAPMV